MVITNKLLVNFRNMAELFLRHKPGDTKLHIAVKKVNKKTEKLYEDYLADQQDAKDELASIDSNTKVLIVKDNSYSFTKEDKKKLNNKLRELADLVITVEPHYVKKEDCPPQLGFNVVGGYSISDYEVRTAFEGFVLEETDAE